MILITSFNLISMNSVFVSYVKTGPKASLHKVE